MGNALLKTAAHQRPAVSKRGILERLFTLAFQGFVYNQIWEDPMVDLEALRLEPHHRLITIASAGCNVLNYLTANPGRIIAVDLNPNHVQLTKLKIKALENLPDYETFFQFFGAANDRRNAAVFEEFIAPNLDSETRRYWRARTIRGRRIDMFTRNLYRYGLLGRFIGILHALARINGKRIDEILGARDMREQRTIYERGMAPLFDSKLVRVLARTPVSFYGLGIPPAQYDELVASAADGNPITTLRARIERLACDFPIAENYFAWQAFSRGYDIRHGLAVPPYLRSENFVPIKSRLGRIELHHASMTDFLHAQPARSLHRYVLLDAQDWMTAEQMSSLWTEIDRTAVDGDARVIFRTAGPDSPLSQKIPGHLLSGWQYLETPSREWHARDRSAIYGGFHCYVRRVPN
jgi:S-adenosylmethionine-diacylglycerol 3-amino-3-carboxypropyl transferase